MVQLRQSRKLEISDSASSLPATSFSGPSALWRISDAQFGPYKTEGCREIVETIEEMHRLMQIMRAHLHILRHATFADQQAVQSVLRYAFHFPELVVLIGRLLKAVGEVQMFDPAIYGNGGT